MGGLRAVTVGAAQTITVGASPGDHGRRQRDRDLRRRSHANRGRKPDRLGGQGRGVQDRRGSRHRGRQRRRLKVGKKLSIDAGDRSIRIKTGAASITMKKDGTIEIKGKDNHDRGLGQDRGEGPQHQLGGEPENTMKGSMVNAEASGINTIKGSLVKIN